MQDDTKKLADDAPPSHAQINRPGMTNGVPDEADAGSATGAPHDDRHDSETAASNKGADS